VLVVRLFGPERVVPPGQARVSASVRVGFRNLCGYSGGGRSTAYESVADHGEFTGALRDALDANGRQAIEACLDLRW
jgi:hypothetical protein